MVKMIAARRHYLKTEGREIEAGAEFTVDSERDARRLVKMRRATRASEHTKQQPKPAAAAPAPAPIETKVMRAAEPPRESAADPRRYNRRDLQAKE